MTRTQFPNPVGCYLPMNIIQVRVEGKLIFLWTVAQRELLYCVPVVLEKMQVQAAVPPIDKTVWTILLMGSYLFQFLLVLWCLTNSSYALSIQHASGQSSYHENRVIPSQLMNTNSLRKNNSCIIQDKFLENQENQLTWWELMWSTSTRVLAAARMYVKEVDAPVVVKLTSIQIQWWP